MTYPERRYDWGPGISPYSANDRRIRAISRRVLDRRTDHSLACTWMSYVLPGRNRWRIGKRLGACTTDFGRVWAWYERRGHYQEPGPGLWHRFESLDGELKNTGTWDLGVAKFTTPGTVHTLDSQETSSDT